MLIVRPIAIDDSGSFTRASVGTYFDYTGTLCTAPVNTPRFSFNPANLNQGASFLLEGAATNLALNSTLGSNQAITTTAQNYTLSFYGSGTVSFNGTATGAVTGVDSNTLTSMTFTASAGTLNIICTGTVQYIQVEAGNAATSRIVTAGTTVTRAAESNSTKVVSDLVETPPAVWASGTTYGAGDHAYIGTVGSLLTVYESLAGGNAANTPASSPTWWKQIGTTYAVWNSGTTYASGALVIMPGSGTHNVYQSLQASNVNHTPVTNGGTDTWWNNLGADNWWAGFDTTVTTQSSKANCIGYGLTLPGRADSIVLMNLSAAYVRVTQTDVNDGIVYDETFTLTSTSGIIDYYAYCFEPIQRYQDISINNLYPYANSTVSVSVIDIGSTPAVGVVIPGLSKDFGPTQYTSQVGIQDYSIKTQDAFGNYTITVRAFRKTATFIVLVKPDNTDTLQNTLAAYRAQAVVYVGSSTFGCTVIYGFSKDYQLEFTDAGESTLTIDLEGLT